MSKLKVAYQLYSARDDVEKGMLPVLKKLAKMGYDGVEFAGFFGHSAKEINEMLAETKLKAASSHVPVAEMKKDLDGVIAFHKKIGCKHIAVPYLEEAYRPGQPGFADMIRFLFEAGRKCRQQGIKLLYHNHDFEFVKVSGMYGLDFMYASLPEKYLQTEIDTCWVKYAGVDPVSYVKQYKGRAPVLHLKDYNGVHSDTAPYALIGLDDPQTSTESTFAFRPFGHGVQDVKALLKAGQEAKVQWFVVEQDESKDMPALQAAELSLRSIRENS